MSLTKTNSRFWPEVCVCVQVGGGVGGVSGGARVVLLPSPLTSPPPPPPTLPKAKTHFLFVILKQKNYGSRVLYAVAVTTLAPQPTHNPRTPAPGQNKICQPVLHTEKMYVMEGPSAGT